MRCLFVGILVFGLGWTKTYAADDPDPNKALAEHLAALGRRLKVLEDKAKLPGGTSGNTDAESQIAQLREQLRLLQQSRSGITPSLVFAIPGGPSITFTGANQGSEDGD